MSVSRTEKMFCGSFVSLASSSSLRPEMPKKGERKERMRKRKGRRRGEKEGRRRKWKGGILEEERRYHRRKGQDYI